MSEASPPRRRGGRVVSPLAERLRRLAPAVLLLLGACSGADDEMVETCIATLPALEEGNGPIAVVAVAPLGEHAVRIGYRSGAGSAVHPHEIACAFAAADGGRRELVGLRTEQGPLPLARLFVLRRFWLADPALRTAGLARVAVAPGLR